jgi:hypothetical protein
VEIRDGLLLRIGLQVREAPTGLARVGGSAAAPPRDDGAGRAGRARVARGDGGRVVRTSVFAVAVCAGGLIAAASPAEPAVGQCTQRPHAYAGVVGRRQVGGVRAIITAIDRPVVVDGQVGGWVGVGGPDAGPAGAAEWIQGGLSSFSNGESQLYYEISEPGNGISYTTVDAAVGSGASFAVAVVEIASRPNWWRFEVNGRAVSPAVLLPGSHGNWEATATAETWNGRAGACNRFSYRFDALSAYHTGAWRPVGKPLVLSDRGYGLEAQTGSSFVAKSLFGADAGTRG